MQFESSIMNRMGAYAHFARRALGAAMLMVVVAVAIATTALAAPATADNDPADRVKSMVERALNVVRNKELSLDAKRGEFKDLVGRHFDLSGMARDSLGEHWPQLDAAAQSKFSQAFNDLVSDTYLGEIRDYDRAQLQDVSQELRGATAEVSGTMRGGNDEVADLKIKLRDIAGQWKIHDYSFNNGSSMRNYSGDFKQAFEHGGFDGLMNRVKRVQSKVSAELAQGSRAAGSPKSVE